MRDRLLSQLGICRKAGRLACGFDATAEAVRRGEAGLVLTAKDLSPKSTKEISFITARNGVETTPAGVTIDEIEWKIGKRAGILAVTDKNLAAAVKREIACANDDEE